MRTLTASLLAAQKEMSMDPLLRITLSDPALVEDDVVLENDSIIQVPAGIDSPDSQTVEVVLNNSDGYFTSLNLKGWDAVVERGLVTAAGNEYDALPLFKVLDQQLSSDRNALLCDLYLIGIPNRLAEDKAEMNAPYNDYHHHWSSTKTVKDLITEIADGQPVAEVLTEEQTTYNDYIDLYSGDINSAGVRLTIDDRTVKTWSFKLKKTGSPTGDVTFYVYDDAGNLVVNKVLSNASALTTSAVKYTVTWDTPLELDGEYIVFVDYGGGDSSNYVSVQVQLPTDALPYGGNVKADENGVHYTAAESLDDPDTEVWEITNGSYEFDCVYWYTYDYAGIDAYDHCEAYEVVFDSEDSLIDTYLPADSFIIHDGDGRWDRLNWLIQCTGCVMRSEDDGKLHVFVPTTTGTSYDAEYSNADGDHQFFGKSNRDALVIPNRIVAHSYPDDETQYSGAATSAASYALLPVTGTPVVKKLESDAQAASIAAARIAQLEIESQRGSATVPINLGAEPYDYVKVTDARQGDYRVGNHLTLKWNYNSGRVGQGQVESDWLMQFSFGKFTPKRVWGTKPSALTGNKRLALPGADQSTIMWGDLKPSLSAIEDNFEYCWSTFDAIISAYDKLINVLGLTDDQPVNGQIIAALVNYYTKTQVDALAEHFVWLDTPILLLSETNVTTYTSWSDLDISSSIPDGTTHVYLQLVVNIDSHPSAFSTSLGVRKNGTSPTYYPEVRVFPSMPVDNRYYQHVLCAVGSDKIIEVDRYVLGIYGAQSDLSIRLLGYFKKG